MKKYQYFPEVVGAVLCLSLGMFSGYLGSPGDYTWYKSLVKPVFNPPAYVFGPVWTILYIMMGVAVGRIWKLKEESVLFPLFLLQFALNLTWSPVFFYLQRVDLALLNLALLWGSLALFMLKARPQKPIFYLFLPYFLWTSFAFYLNYSLYMLNR